MHVKFKHMLSQVTTIVGGNLKAYRIICGKIVTQAHAPTHTRKSTMEEANKLVSLNMHALYLL